MPVLLVIATAAMRLLLRSGMVLLRLRMWLLLRRRAVLRRLHVLLLRLRLWMVLNARRFHAWLRLWLRPVLGMRLGLR